MAEAISNNTDPTYDVAGSQNHHHHLD